MRRWRRGSWRRFEVIVKRSGLTKPKGAAMTTKSPDSGLVVRAARANICPHCPVKWGPERTSIDAANPCELRCELFHHLPAITDAAACADPMLRPVEAAAAGEIAIRVPAWRK